MRFKAGANLSQGTQWAMVVFTCELRWASSQFCQSVCRIKDDCTDPLLWGRGSRAFIRFSRGCETKEEEWKSPGQSHMASHSRPETTSCVPDSQSLPYTCSSLERPSSSMHLIEGLDRRNTMVSNRWRICCPAGTAHRHWWEELGKTLELQRINSLLNCSQKDPKQGEGDRYMAFRA